MNSLSNYIRTLPEAEIIGIVAGLLVLAGFLFRKVAIIRSVSLLACCMYIWYGAVIGSPSIIIINGIVAVIQIVYLTKESIKNRRNTKHGTHNNEAE